MSGRSYSLNELSAESGVNVRAIRRYIEDRVLPGAAGRGPNSHYTSEHLDRLRAIQRLKDRFERKGERKLTMKELCQVLQRLSPRRIREIADGRAQVAAFFEIDDEATPDSALSYLSDLKSGRRSATRSDSRKKGGRARRTASGGAGRTTVEEVADALQELAGSGTVTHSRGSEWHRIEITPDIELCVRGCEDDQIGQFERIGDLLRHLLTRGVRRD